MPSPLPQHGSQQRTSHHRQRDPQTVMGNDADPVTVTVQPTAVPAIASDNEWTTASTCSAPSP